MGPGLALLPLDRGRLPEVVREGEREGERASSTSSSSITRASALPSDRDEAEDDSAKVKER